MIDIKLAVPHPISANINNFYIQYLFYGNCTELLKMLIKHNGFFSKFQVLNYFLYINFI